ncbi:MAG: PD-(D/E)XK nuclease family protein, partial [Tepidiformaceae bacterium]
AERVGEPGTAMPDNKDEQSDDEAPWKKGRAGTAVGRAVHAVLQTIDLATGEGLDAAARAQAAAEGVEDRLRDVVSFAEAARQSAAVQAAVASGRFWREVYVSALIDGTVVEGFIDLLYEAREGLVVVDYKTDSVVGEAIDSAVERYRLQGAAYALALQQSLARPVASCTFVFVQPRDERPIAELPAAIDEVRALLRAASAPNRSADVP